MSNMELRRLCWIFIVAVVLNYLWELAQMPLYAGMEAYTARVFWHCFVASLGDGVMVLLIVAGGWIVLRRSDWFLRPGVPGHSVMITVGLILAILVEWLGLHVLRRWEYSQRMPILPGFNVGLAPIGQMLFLPPLIFRLVRIYGF